jgi:hypothetical protein
MEEHGKQIKMIRTKLALVAGYWRKWVYNSLAQKLALPPRIERGYAD